MSDLGHLTVDDLAETIEKRASELACFDPDATVAAAACLDALRLALAELVRRAEHADKLEEAAEKAWTLIQAARDIEGAGNPHDKLLVNAQAALLGNDESISRWNLARAALREGKP